jgi:multicomponent Na+:H+ antiporter subunit D
VAIMFTLGGLLLAALPPFTLFAGKSLLEESATSTGYAWLIAIFIIGSAATGAAVLRVSARVFLGWGPSVAPDAGQVRPEEQPEEEMSGAPENTPAMMLLVPAVLLIGALVVGLIPGFVPAAERFAARFTDHAAYAAWVLRGQAVNWPVAPVSHVSGLDVLYSALSVLLAITAAAVGLFGRPWQARIPTGLQRRWLRGLHTVRDLHSGHIGDYIAWWTAAASLLGAVCLVALG